MAIQVVALVLAHVPAASLVRLQRAVRYKTKGGGSTLVFALGRRGSICLSSTHGPGAIAGD